MLLDANLDGAISPEELMRVLNFVKAEKSPEPPFQVLLDHFSGP